MSRSAPLEVCARCEMFKPGAEMTNVYARDAHGEIVILRLCHTCASPVLTYITGQAARPLWIDTRRLVLASLAIIIVVLNLVFGLAFGGARGFALLIAGAVLGAGILTVFAVDMK